MHHRKWARALASACLAGSLVVGMAGPASASTVTGTVTLTKGDTSFLVACPTTGERFVSGTATFYRQEGGKVLETVTATPESPNVARFAVPKGARFASYTIECQPVNIVVLTTGVATESSVTVNCPATHPYLVSVQEVIGDADGDLGTSQGQYFLAYETTPNGVRFLIPVGHAYRVLFACSLDPQPPL